MRIQKDGPSPGVHAESSEYDVIAGSYDPPGLFSQTARRQLLKRAVESAVISGGCRARSLRGCGGDVEADVEADRGYPPGYWDEYLQSYSIIVLECLKGK